MMISMSQCLLRSSAAWTLLLLSGIAGAVKFAKILKCLEPDNTYTIIAKN
jgi:hypothetical protein